MLSTRGAAAWFDKVAAQCQNSRRLDRPRRRNRSRASAAAAGAGIFCARVALPALLRGPSTSPLEDAAARLMSCRAKRRLAE